jgi:FkbM family methyltransferase
MCVLKQNVACLQDLLQINVRKPFYPQPTLAHTTLNCCIKKTEGIKWMGVGIRRALHDIELFSERLLVRPWRRYRRHEESHLTKLLKHLSVDCVFDVGANAGQYAQMLREYCGYKGRIISFEPTPALVDKLRMLAEADPLWTIEGIALGSTGGTQIFNTWTTSQSNSFLPPGSDEGLSINQAQGISVQIARLDDIYPMLRAKYGFSRPFLKMDTQGYDLEVVAGAEKTLPDFLGLQSELAIRPFYAGAPDWLKSLQIYEKNGFQLSALVENNDIQFPELREVDCIMIRSINNPPQP